MWGGEIKAERKTKGRGWRETQDGGYGNKRFKIQMTKEKMKRIEIMTFVLVYFSPSSSSSSLLPLLPPSLIPPMSHLSFFFFFSKLSHLSKKLQAIPDETIPVQLPFLPGSITIKKPWAMKFTDVSVSEWVSE